MYSYVNYCTSGWLLLNFSKMCLRIEILFSICLQSVFDTRISVRFKKWTKHFHHNIIENSLIFKVIKVYCMSRKQHYYISIFGLFLYLRPSVNIFPLFTMPVKRGPNIKKPIKKHFNVLLKYILLIPYLIFRNQYQKILTIFECATF